MIPDHIRIFGLVFALGLALYGLLKYRSRGWRRSDLFLALVVALGVGTVAVLPQVGEPFAGLLDLENRAFALLSVSTLILFGLFIYILGELRETNRRNGSLVSALAVREYAGENPDRVRRDRGTGGRILIIVPAFNEAGSIRDVLVQIPQEISGLAVRTVVVDDGSSDGTREVSESLGVPVASLAVNRGQGDALRTGFEIARRERAEIAINLDADGQYRVEDIEKLIAPILAGDADYVHGSRFLGYYEEAGSVRHAGVVFFSRLISLLTRVRITDATNGLRAIRGSELYKLDLREDRFNATELILEAIRNGLRLQEVPVSMLRRAEGESKKPPRLWYPLGVLRVIFQTWLR